MQDNCVRDTLFVSPPLHTIEAIQNQYQVFYVSLTGSLVVILRIKYTMFILDAPHLSEESKTTGTLFKCAIVF